jgi:hypothetical protein
MVMRGQTVMNNTGTTTYRDLSIFRTGRSLVLDELAREQAILNHANETDMSEEQAAELNQGSFRDRGEKNFFKNQYRRHKRNIAEGNRFY